MLYKFLGDQYNTQQHDPKITRTVHAHLCSHPIDFRDKNSSHDGKLKAKKKVEIYFHQAYVEYSNL